MTNDTTAELVTEAVQKPIDTTSLVSDNTKVVSAESPFFAFVGINEAARLTGKTKTQIYRDIEASKLSWQFDQKGGKKLQIADLDRVYGLKKPVDTGSKDGIKDQMKPLEKPKDTTSDTTELAVKLAVLEERLRAKDEVIRMQTEQIEDLRDQREKLQDQTQRLTLMLPPPAANNNSLDASQKRSWWDRITGK
jgi:hypothetical protein